MKLAADTNVLLDLADGVDDVIDALQVIGRRLPDAELLVTPSVLEELAYLADSGVSAAVRRSGSGAIDLLRSGLTFKPLLEIPSRPEFLEEVADLFRKRGLLPVREVHDSLILAEAVSIGCQVLLTSDEHLRGIDHQQLTWALALHDLKPPVIATPREIVRKFFR